MDYPWNENLPTRLCRLCSQSEQSNKWTYIFSPEDDNMDGLADLINTLLPINVSQVDPLPKQVCQDCLESLQLLNEFSLSCIAAEENLFELLESQKFSVKDQDNLGREEFNEALMDCQERESSECGNSGDSKSSEIDQLRSGNDGGQEIVTLPQKLPIQKIGCPLCFDGDMDPYAEPCNRRNIENRLSEPESFEERLMKQYLRANEENNSDLSEVEDCSSDDENLKTEAEMGDKSPHDEDYVMIDDENDEDFQAPVEGRSKSLSMKQRRMSQRGRRKRGNGRSLSRGLGSQSVKEESDNLIWIKGEGQQSVPLVQCVHCDGWFPGFASCLQHSLVTHVNVDEAGAKIFLCTCCKAVATSCDDLVIHFTKIHCPGGGFVVEEDGGDIIVRDCRSLESHHNSCVSYSCLICQKIFSSLLNFLRHSCSQVDCSDMRCNICDQVYRNRQRFVFHMNFHSAKAPPLECDVCSEKFADDSLLYDHVRFAHLKDNVVCDECGKHFRSEKGLTSHQLSSHSSDPSVLNRHKCNVCGKGYREKQGLREHQVTHMTVKPYPCDKCDRAYNRYSRLKQHQMSHVYLERMDCYECLVCGLAFPSQDKAMEHSNEEQHEIQSITLSKVLRCEFCDSVFSRPTNLNKHRVSHVGEKPYVCHICGASFHTYSRVTTHKTTHGIYDQIEPQEGDFAIPRYFLCEHCGLSYPYWSYLQTHRRMRHSENPYTLSCKLCPEKFKNSWSVLYHRRKVHEKDGSEWRRRSKECPHCGIHCMYQHTLDKHIERKHSTSKGDGAREQYQCEECGKVFKYQSSLGLHQKMHKGQKNFFCEECDKSFLTIATLRNHNKRCHQGVKPHQCEFCGKAFFHRVTRDDHLRVHTGEKPFKCQHCEKSFRLKSMLTDHSKIHNDHRPYPCDVCGSSFRRMVHMKQHRMLHTGEKPFQCGICLQDYRLKQELQRHMKTKHGESNTEDMEEEDFIFAE